MFCPLDSCLFLKKDMDFEKYKIKLTVRACCLFEQLSGKNFFSLSDGDDILMLLYSALVANNENLLMTYSVFKVLVQDAKVAKWIEQEYKKLTDFSAQLKGLKIERTAGVMDKESEETKLSMTEIASSLIIQHGVDAHYVMEEMELWEIFYMFNAADSLAKNKMAEKRFWTYLEISPHINTKKCKGPSDLFEFSWEKNEKSNTLEKNTQAAFSFLSTQNKNEEDNGEQ